MILSACKSHKTGGESPEVSNIDDQNIENVVKAIVNEVPGVNTDFVKRGVSQAAALWRESDGNPEDFAKFCIQNFAADENARLLLFNKLQKGFETLFGHYNKMGLSLKEGLHLEGGELTPIDELLGGYEPGSHFADDFYANKVAFLTILNFPHYSLIEKGEKSTGWSRQDWAYAIMGDVFTSRVPASLNQKLGETLTAADTYISEYNIFMGNLINSEGEILFPADMKLISHWGLRDELKSNYQAEKGNQKQEMIYAVMKHIIGQSIPSEVINSNEYQWNPLENKVLKDGKEVQFSPEPDKRYAVLLGNYQVLKEMDPYFPAYPDYVSRSFETGMKIPFQEVEKLFVDYISSPLIKQTGELIAQRLGRALKPYDIWYDGFKSRSSISEDELTKITSAKYPDAAAFKNDLPNILTKLGFAKERADFLASKIEVDAARGSGHAWGASMKSENAHLRTRIVGNGLNYKGYNIAVHELGHNVEQTISLQNVDYYMLNGVPNTAFTEALAFLFQKRDLELLGMSNNNPEKDALMTLDNFWASYEIMGVSLVDMYVWNWMYANPDATPEKLKEAVISTAKEVWNKYYAPVFGIQDEPILAIYSHMIDNPLYLPAYPMGHVIDFQIEQYLKNKNFAQEVDRIYRIGNINPQVWMKEAVGTEISIEPQLKAAQEALTVLKK